MAIYFLSLEDVLEIHADQINRYGGKSGIRDQNLLLSAIAQPVPKNVFKRVYFLFAL